MVAARSGEDSIGRDTREAFLDQLLVGRSTAERAWIGPASIAVLRLDEHQRRHSLCSAWTHQTELAPVVQSTPRIADALHT